jgi:hypothetical protein
VVRIVSRRQCAAVFVCILLAPVVDAQAVNVWLTTDDRKALLQRQPDLMFTSDRLGGWLEFDNIDFGSGPTAVDIRWGSGGSGGTLEFRLDNPSGPIIARGSLPVTGGWQSWQTFSIPASGARGPHTLFVIFRGPSSGLGKLNWFRFR